MPRTITTEEFIKKAKAVHGDKYDYSLVDYKNCKIKIKIICPIHGVFEQTPDKHLNDKNGCKKCASEKLREDRKDKDFIQRAKAIHGDKYDYSLVDYKNNQTKVKIICPIHGIFEQNAYYHINGGGCPECSRKKIKKEASNKEEFIKKIKEIHGDKYDYSLVEYKNSRTKVKIICPIHGIFEQTPNNHLLGAGCPDCSGRKRLTTEEFAQRARAIHGDKYDYSLVDYKNNKTKVKIICPVHGIFEQTPLCHLSGNNCPQCSSLENGKKQTFTNIEFIEKAKEIHGDKYDYSLVDYKNAHSKVSIICKKHGIFEQIAYRHLDGGGCPSCSNISNGEEIINNYLVENNITFEIQKKFDGLVDKSYLTYDFYIPSKNLLIEFNGKQHYCWQKHLQPSYHDFLIQKHHDWLKRKYAQKHNINLLSIPFKEIKNLKNILKERVIECQEN